MFVFQTHNFFPKICLNQIKGTTDYRDYTDFLAPVLSLRRGSIALGRMAKLFSHFSSLALPVVVPDVIHVTGVLGAGTLIAYVVGTFTSVSYSRGGVDAGHATLE